MKLFIAVIGILQFLQISCWQLTNKRVLCYYDSESSLRKGYARFTEQHLRIALPKCTHLMYGYACLDPKTYELALGNLTLNLQSIKRDFPNLKIYLSLGGDKDCDETKYLGFLEAGKEKQEIFINSSRKVLENNDFDGLDLAFPFPHNKPHDVHAVNGKVWNEIKQIFTNDDIVDKRAIEHKHLFTEFVKNLKKAYNNLSLAMTVMPNVNSTWYFEISKIHNKFEFINIFAFDFLTPRRNPEEADYTAPIFLKEGANRLPYQNIEYQVNHWIHNECPANKLNLGIATYGRAWKLSTDSGLSGMPVVENTQGPAEQGSQEHISGLLSYPEICLKLSGKPELFKVADKTQKYGNYAFIANKTGGIWVSYDDPEFAAIKTEYVYCKGMGGVALYDLSFDDFRNHCMDEDFPILRAVTRKLNGLKQCPRIMNLFPAIKRVWQRHNYNYVLN